MKKLVFAAAIACASFIGGTANAQNACWSPPGGSYLKSCRNIEVTGPTCDSRSSTSWNYGYEVNASCLVRGQYKQAPPYAISTNEGNGGGTPKIQTRTCSELENANGFLKCTKR